MTHRVYLGLGSNLGHREATILRAYRHIERLIGTIRCRSAFFYSDPWGFVSENAFVNSVVCAETTLTPRQVLHRTRLIERLLGKTRQHATERNNEQCAMNNEQCSMFNVQCSIINHQSPRAVVYHDRPIDIDILLYDDWQVSDADLTIPHPLMHARPFVMTPLREVEERLRSVEQAPTP